jgi:voltage-gated sodium channel type II alpha
MDLTEGELDAYRDKKSVKELNNQFEVAIGDGMEFTIHGKFVRIHS